MALSRCTTGELIELNFPAPIFIKARNMYVQSTVIYFLKPEKVAYASYFHDEWPNLYVGKMPNVSMHWPSSHEDFFCWNNFDKSVAIDAPILCKYFHISIKQCALVYNCQDHIVVLTCITRWLPEWRCDRSRLPLFIEHDRQAVAKHFRVKLIKCSFYSIHTLRGTTSHVLDLFRHLGRTWAS